MLSDGAIDTAGAASDNRRAREGILHRYERGAGMALANQRSA